MGNGEWADAGLLSSAAYYFAYRGELGLSCAFSGEAKFHSAAVLAQSMLIKSGISGILA